MIFSKGMLTADVYNVRIQPATLHRNIHILMSMFGQCCRDVFCILMFVCKIILYQH